MKRRTGKVIYLSRKANGQGIIEGTAGLMMVTAGIVLGVLLLVNAGLTAFYKEKIGFIANQAASYAANLPRNAQLDNPTRRFVNDMAQHMGFHGSLQVSVQRVAVGDQPGAKVSLNANGLMIIGYANIFPGIVSLSDTAVAARDISTPDGILYLFCRGQNKNNFQPNTQLAIPTYGRVVRGISDSPKEPLYQRPDGTAVFHRALPERYWMSYPSGGFNQSTPGALYSFFDYPTTNRQNPPPADGPLVSH